jgi:hypothetical protein
VAAAVGYFIVAGAFLAGVQPLDAPAHRTLLPDCASTAMVLVLWMGGTTHAIMLHVLFSTHGPRNRLSKRPTAGPRYAP